MKATSGWEAQVAKVFAMSEKVWRRHANPWSVYTRIPALIPLTLAIWSRTWIGAWAIPLCLAVIAWLWWNPRMFPPPSSHENWASQAVFGERIWLNRGEVPVAKSHEGLIRLLTVISSLGLPFLVWGLWALAIWPTLLGLTIIFLGKLWFCDRMVWLLQDTYRSDPAYAESLGYHDT